MRATRSDDIVLDDAFVPDFVIARIVPAGTADAFVLGIFAWALLEVCPPPRGAQRAMDLRGAGGQVKDLDSGQASQTMALRTTRRFVHMVAELRLLLDSDRSTHRSRGTGLVGRCGSRRGVAGEDHIGEVSCR